MNSELKEITPEILKADHDAYYEAERMKRYDMKSNRASAMGSCMRYIVYARTQPELQQKPDIGLQKVFGEGHVQEEAIITRLRGLGYTVSKQQYIIGDHPELKAADITGHTDLTIERQGYKPALLEAKSMSPHIFPGVNGVEDFNKHAWSKKYKAQSQLYMYGTGHTRMMFYVKCKQDGDYKFLEMKLDLKYIDHLINKAHLINNHIKEGTLPKREYDYDDCDRCWFNHVCLPDQHFTGVEWCIDLNLYNILKNREEEAGGFKRYKMYHEQARAILRTMKGEMIALPGFHVKLGWSEGEDGKRTFRPTIKATGVDPIKMENLLDVQAELKKISEGK